MVCLVALFSLFASFTSLNLARANVSLLEKDQWKISMGGFIELDTIADSTRSLSEASGNTPIDRPDTLAGMSGRTQFSVRNSRLSFLIDAPEFESWKSKGLFEFDFLGFDPGPGTAGNTEANFYNSPTVRVRQAYMSVDNGRWQILVGQNWMLFGFQPYYFMPTLEVSPLPAMLYNRTGQVRVVETCKYQNGGTIQSALALMRPPQRDAQYPGFEGGFRFALASRSAGFTGGATGAQKTQPMSLAITGAFREIAIPVNPSALSPSGDKTNFPASAMAVDALLPIIPSKDGNDVSNTLVIGGEYSFGKGYGDQFVGWTGNLSSPLNATGVAPDRNVNLDAGVGGFDPFGNFQLVRLKSFNAYFQFHFPAVTRTWISGGYGKLTSDNIDLLTGSGSNANRTSAGKIPYDKQQVLFGNIAHDFTTQFRMGFEFSHIRTNYQDLVNTHNNRYQLSAYFLL